MKQLLRNASIVIALALTAAISMSSISPLGTKFSGGGGAGGGTAPPPRHAPELQRVGGINLMPMVNMHVPMIGRGASPYYKVP